VICRPRALAEWQIDTWLMSCRVLGRRVEQMVLREVVDHAKRRGIRWLIGTYRPTDRNKLVEDHYAKLRFSHIGQDADGTTTWSLDASSATIETAFMVVRSIGFPKATDSHDA